MKGQEQSFVPCAKCGKPVGEGDDYEWASIENRDEIVVWCSEHKPSKLVTPELVKEWTSTPASEVGYTTWKRKRVERA